MRVIPPNLARVGLSIGAFVAILVAGRLGSTAGGLVDIHAHRDVIIHVATVSTIRAGAPTSLGRTRKSELASLASERDVAIDRPLCENALSCASRSRSESDDEWVSSQLRDASTLARPC
jgi:hypothetical protein